MKIEGVCLFAGVKVDNENWFTWEGVGQEDLN